MGFLSSRNINLLNLHRSFMRLVGVMSEVFGPIFLYHTGIELPYIFLITAGISFLRIPLRFTAPLIVKKIGLKYTLALSTATECLALLFLMNVAGVDTWLGLYILFQGWSSSIYWTVYHAFFTLSGEAAHRGKHVAAGGAIALLMVAMAPYLSGLFIELEGFTSFFLFVIPLMVLAVLPLFYCTPIYVETSAKRWREEFLSFCARSHMMRAACAHAHDMSWLFMIFLALGSLSHFGGVLTIGLLAQAVFQLFLGHFIDKGHLWRVFLIGVGLVSVVVIAMSQFTLTFAIAALLDIAFAFSLLHVDISFGTALYNESYKSKNILWNWVFSEMWVDIAIVSVRCTVALLLILGLPLNHIILLPLFGLAGLYFVMKGHL